MDFEIDGCCLRGGGACPEQYEVFRGDKMVAYLRLRHGRFYAAVPDVGGAIVYEKRTMGRGSFLECEREKELKLAVNAILDYIGR